MRILQRPNPPVDILGPEDVARIHEQTLAVMGRTGLRILWDKARAALQSAGAELDGEIVRFPPAMIETFVAKAPARFELVTLDAARSLVIGDNTSVCAPTYGATHFQGADGRRRSGDLATLARLHTMMQRAEVLQNVGSNILEPTDVPVPLRHLQVMRSVLLHCDKSFMGVSTSRDAGVAAARMAHVRAADSVAMADIAFGGPATQGPRMVGVATCNNALTWEEASLRALHVFAAAGEAVMVAPFSISGSNSSADPAALLVQVNAEVLAGVIFTQVVREGAPVLYGPYATTFDPVSRNSMAGTPDIVLYMLAFGQLARHYRLPYRGGGQLTGAKRNDYQAGVESNTMLLASMMAGSHFLFHTGGWLEGGLTVDIAKFRLDFEELDKLIRIQGGLRLEGVGDIAARLAGWGHGASHAGGDTPAYIPRFADYRPHGDWEEAQRPSAAELAAQACDLEPEVLLPADKVAALDGFIRRRMRELD